MLNAMMMNLEPNSNLQPKHSDLAPSVSYSHNEVYADKADNNTTTEYLTRC